MSKSIYEEALDIVMECLGQPDKSVIIKHTGLNELKKALKQAQKQEKLLGLYRELDDCIVSPNGHHVCRFTDDEKYARIRKQIKELENE